MPASFNGVGDALTNHGRCDVFDRSVTIQHSDYTTYVQIQEELDQLAQEATANAMNVIKSEKYVFTNNNAYMKLLNKMKEYVMRKQIGHTDEDADARDAKDEVSES